MKVKQKLAINFLMFLYAVAEGLESIGGSEFNGTEVCGLDGAQRWFEL